jgi:hypothetical protein
MRILLWFAWEWSIEMNTNSPEMTRIDSDIGDAEMTRIGSFKDSQKVDPGEL